MAYLHTSRCAQAVLATAGFTLVLSLALSMSGCVNSTIEQVKQPGIAFDNADSIVILARRHENASETEASFTECVEERLSEESTHLKVHPQKAFVDAMFPWFEPRTAPLRTRDLERLMSEPVVADKMAEFGVRYMVWLDGFTETSGRTGTISCTVGPGGAGCFGFGSWEDDSTFDARVWDVASLQNVGTISTDATGQSYVPALVIPIPLIARVEANACIRLADQLKQFVNGE